MDKRETDPIIRVNINVNTGIVGCTAAA